MWSDDGVEQGYSWGCQAGLLEELEQLEELQQTGGCHPPNSGLLPPDDELPVDVKQEEYPEDSMVTDLFLDSDTVGEDPSLDLPNIPGDKGSPKLTTESTSLERGG